MFPESWEFLIYSLYLSLSRSLHASPPLHPSSHISLFLSLYQARTSYLLVKKSSQIDAPYAGSYV